MAEWQERLAYLEGMARGMALDRKEPEGPVLLEVIGVLQGMAREIGQVTEEQEELNDWVVEIDEDLEELEEDYWGDDMEEESLEVTCPRCGLVLEWEEEPGEEEVLDLTCPNCGEVISGEERPTEEVQP